MKQALLIIAILLVLLGGSYSLFGPQKTPAGEVPQGTVDLPWNVTVLENGSSSIFGVNLGTSTLDQLVEKWGRPEKMALFTREGKPLTVEVFFNNPPTGPMKASVVLTLASTEQEMFNIAKNTTGQSGTETGDARYNIAQQDQENLSNHVITTLTYVPSYRGLDATYFEEHLGLPTATFKESDTAESWYYPDIGLTLLIDDEGKEVFQYQTPIGFQLPKDAISTTRKE